MKKTIEQLQKDHEKNFYRNTVIEQYIDEEYYEGDTKEMELDIEKQIDIVKCSDMSSEEENYCFDNGYHDGYAQALRDVLNKI